MSEEGPGENDIAIVGMALRVPGANTPAAFWDNLRNGVESIVDYDEETIEQWRKLMTAANGADTDAWRNSLRQAALDKNREELDRLAAEIKTEPHPPESIVLLYHAMRHAQRRAAD